MENIRKHKSHGTRLFGSHVVLSEADIQAESVRFVDPKRDFDNDPFLNSLETLTPDDIAPPPVKPKLTTSEIINLVVRKTLMVVCLGVFIFSAGSIVSSLYNYKKGSDLYSDIASDFYSGGIDEAASDSAVTRSIQSPKSANTPDFATAQTLSADHSLENEVVTLTQRNLQFEQMKASLNHVAAKYPDLYGWITVPDTKIDYPIVQYTDNDYYLDHDAKGDFLPAGSVFADYRCSKSILKNHNTVLYGHNMINGEMFNNITYYLDETFFNEHQYITVSTLDGIFKYLVFAIYQTDMYYSYINTDFYSHEDFVTFAYEMKANSLFEREGVEFTTTDRILTLSTCTNGPTTHRYCLQALLVETIN